MIAKNTCLYLGLGFLLVGIVGFFVPGFLGMHLGGGHNAVHLITGALAVYLGLKGSLNAARTFCFVFGSLYALLGIAGFVAGERGSNLMVLMPQHLVFGTADHLVHLILGAAFLVAAMVSRPVPVRL